MPENARSIPELLDKAMHFLTRTLKGGDRAMVLLVEGGQPILRAVRGMAELAPGSVAVDVVTRCRLQAKSVLILNAERDPEYGGHPARGEFMSALCVPITPGHSPRVLGMLFVDNRVKPGTFTYLDRSTAEHFAREFGRRLVVLQKEPQVERRRRAVVLAGELVLGASLIGLGLVWGLSGTLIGAASRSAPAEKPAVKRKLESAAPDQVALSFINLVRLDQHQQAYGLLSERLQAEISLPKFQDSLRSWLAEDVNRWELQHRSAVVGEEPPRETIVTLYIEPPPERSGTWIWHMVRQEDGWKLDRLNGGPL